ncbi:MAG: phosphatidylglycerophosphatase A, partial [Acidobacteriota bacterium]
LARRAPLAWSIGTFLGIGHVPVASGTVATLATVPVYLAAYRTGGHFFVLALGVIIVAAGVLTAGILEEKLGYHDPPEVVVDEVAGFLVTMVFIVPTIWTCLAGFLLFRVFDVLKPWPAADAERLPAGWGIMADDLVCGFLANVVIQVGLFLWR